MIFDLEDQYPRFFALAGVNRDMFGIKCYMIEIMRQSDWFDCWLEDILADRAPD